MWLPYSNFTIILRQCGILVKIDMHTYCMYTYYRVLKLQFNVSFVPITSMTNSTQFFITTNYLLVLWQWIIYKWPFNSHNPSTRSSIPIEYACLHTFCDYIAIRWRTTIIFFIKSGHTRPEKTKQKKTKIIPGNFTIWITVYIAKPTIRLIHTQIRCTNSCRGVNPFPFEDTRCMHVHTLA